MIYLYDYYDIYLLPDCIYLACNITKINDGICQDETNVPECGFDGGDCCIPLWNITLDCQNCTCHESTGIPFEPCKCGK